MRLDTTRFPERTGLRAMLGELWALMSLRVRAPTLTGASRPTTCSAGRRATEEHEITIAPAPTSASDAPRAPHSNERRPLEEGAALSTSCGGGSAVLASGDSP